MAGEELSAVRFEDLTVGKDIRLTTQVNGKIQAFSPAPAGIGRMCTALVQGGLFNGTTQTVWMPADDTQAAAMGYTVSERVTAPVTGSAWVHATGAIFSATATPGLYLCVGPAGPWAMGATAYRETLGTLTRHEVS